MIDEINTNGEKFDACGYYNTVLQHKDKLKEMVKDINNYRYSFEYYSDETDSYNMGKIIIYLEKGKSDRLYQNLMNFHYEIELLNDDRMHGYCECTPDMKGYNSAKDCCGIDCDWTAPRVSITRVEDIGNFSFKGFERDMWKLQNEWNKKEKEIKQKYKQKQIENLNEQIADLEKRKQMLINDNT